MKKLILLLAAATGFLAGCVVDDGYYRQGYYDNGRPQGYRDRDGDGVPNRADRRPDNPYRY